MTTPRIPGAKVGGARPGAGAPRGPRKTTIERSLLAERQVLESKAAGRKLAKEVLEEFMLLFAGMAATTQRNNPHPSIPGMIDPNGIGDFVKYAELSIHCAEKLAPYQSPTYRAIVVNAPAAPPNDPTGRYTTGLEIELTDETAIARVYKQFVQSAPPKLLASARTK